MKKVLIAVALVASLAMAQEAMKKQDGKKSEMKSEMKSKPGMEMKSAMAGHKVSMANSLQWGPAPASLPPGGQLAVLQGNPMAAGEYTIRLKAPDGYKIPAHWHPAAESVTVISGEFHLGMGDKWDDSKAEKLGVGDFVTMNKGQRHYAWTKGETVVQVSGMGPFKIVYVNAADDPTKKK